MPDLTDAETLPAKADPKRQVDFDDLQNELAGNETGRLTRFLSADDDRSPEGKRRKRERQAEHDRLLVALLKDPEYAAAYGELGKKLGTAEREADTAITLVQAQLRKADQIIEDMEMRAARDLDGRIVLRMENGQVLYSDGSTVRPDIAEGIIWPDDAPSGDAYFTAKRQRTQLAEHLRNWETYRNDTLGSIRDKYDDSENPYKNVDDMKDALDAMEAARPELSKIEFPSATSAAAAPAHGLQSMVLATSLN